MIFLGYAILASLTGVLMYTYVMLGLKSIKQVAKLPVIDDEPSLAIIIPVRNEEEDIEKALESVCSINYKNHRVIVINDRSTDRTGDILEGFKLQYSQLTITTIVNLPEGWIGKNYALYQGYKNTDEEWLLFIDADIVFQPDAINRAVGYAVSQKLDHLGFLPETISRSILLNSVMSVSSYLLMVHMRPWAAKNPKSPAFIGIGAFNLLRRSAYEKAGTHEKIKHRPDDDVQLGIMMKQGGFRQDVLAGSGCVSLEWYKNLHQFGRGILKNSFALANYNLLHSLGNLFAISFCIALPVPILLIFGSNTERLMAMALFLFQLIYMTFVLPNKWWHALVIPFAGCYIAYFVLKSALLTLKQGGIYWRDSFYSLKMLKGKKR
jgi:cellulose synthase/poly-beta-1,6-N-acetylglucosamine synthase-like glycosyltransferase